MRILIVDGCPQSRQRMVDHLVEYEVEIDQATDVDEAQNYLDLMAEDYDLVIADGHRPSEEIKAQHPEISVLMLTTRDQKTEAVKAVLKGAENILFREEEHTQFLEKVKNVLSFKNKHLDIKLKG